MIDLACLESWTRSVIDASRTRMIRRGRREEKKVIVRQS